MIFGPFNCLARIQQIVAMFAPAICQLTVREVVRSMKYVADLVGVDHVGSGSDFDGATKTVVDASGMALFTEELLKQGFSQDDVAKIMGGNILRVLRQTLPDSAPETGG